jgi:hypothetical protein
MNKTFEQRNGLIEAFLAVTAELENHRSEGLITDLEMMRKVYLECHTTYSKLDCCTACGAGNEGNHYETYGGNLCPECNPDKRRYVLAYGKDRVNTPPESLFHHQVIGHAEIDSYRMKNVEEMLVCSRIVVGEGDEVSFLLRVV